MSAMRCVQNFSRRRAVIISTDTRGLERLDDSLLRLGLQVIYILPDKENIDIRPETLSAERDVLFLDGDLGVSVDIPRVPDSELTQIPVVGMVGIEAPGRLGRLYSSGATAFIKKPIHVGTVYSTLFMAVNEFNQRHVWHKMLLAEEKRRKQRRYVIKAVVLLMKRYKLSDDGAYEQLRRQSMREQISIETLARRLVEQAECNEITMHFEPYVDTRRSDSSIVSAESDIYSIQESS